METKESPNPNGCLAKALADEPFFVLLARDASAPDIVRAWAAQRAEDVQNGHKPQGDMLQVNEALETADAMTKWRLDNWPKRKGETPPPARTVYWVTSPNGGMVSGTLSFTQHGATHAMVRAFVSDQLALDSYAIDSLWHAAVKSGFRLNSSTLMAL